MSDRTLPTLGAIKKQTISGAIATGTHGSGRPSLSHFVVRLRAAVFDPDTGTPVIREFAEAPSCWPRAAAWAAWGSSSRLTCPPCRNIWWRRPCANAAASPTAQALFAENPLTNFLWSPYSWTVLAFERASQERTQSPGQRLKALFFRLFNFVMLDVVFHLLVIAACKFGRGGIKLLFSIAPHTMPMNRTRVDDVEQVLTFNHDLFRHEEMELFVAERRSRPGNGIPSGCGRSLLAGRRARRLRRCARAVSEAGLSDDVGGLAGSYVHHYPLFFRRVLPEETMVSMGASIEEPVYSISIFTY